MKRARGRTDTSGTIAFSSLPQQQPAIIITSSAAAALVPLVFGEDVVDDWQHEQEGQVRGAANQALVRRLAAAAAIGSGQQQKQ